MLFYGTDFDLMLCNPGYLSGYVYANSYGSLVVRNLPAGFDKSKNADAFFLCLTPSGFDILKSLSYIAGTYYSS